MRFTISILRRLAGDTRGATLVEYGLILFCIVLALFGAAQTLGTATSGLWNNFSGKVINAT